MGKFDSLAKIGFVYEVELFAPYSDRRVSHEIVHNLVPIEGLNYLLATGFRDGTKQPNWYVGLYEGNYTPTSTVTAATLGGLATECTAYASATRPAWTTVAPTDGTLDNLATRAEFISTVDKTLYGGFIASSSAKGATTGVLGSVVKFAASKAFTVGSTLRVRAGISFVSV